MLLASDALSTERTVGFYMLTACDFTQNQVAEFAQFDGGSESLLMFAMSYDGDSAQLLDRRIFETSIHRNVTEMRKMMRRAGFDEICTMMRRAGFDEICTNLTQDERTELSLRWGHDMEDFILTVDEVREDILIPSILQVNSVIREGIMRCIQCSLVWLAELALFYVSLEYGLYDVCTSTNMPLDAACIVKVSSGTIMKLIED